MNRQYWKNFKWSKTVFDITTAFSNQYGKELLVFIANKSVFDKKYANGFNAQFIFNCEIIMLENVYDWFFNKTRHSFCFFDCSQLRKALEMLFHKLIWLYNYKPNRCFKVVRIYIEFLFFHFPLFFPRRSFLHSI